MAAVCSPAFRRLCNSRLRSNAGAIRHLTAELTDHLAMCNTHLEDRTPSCTPLSRPDVRAPAPMPRKTMTTTSRASGSRGSPDRRGRRHRGLDGDCRAGRPLRACAGDGDDTASQIRDRSGSQNALGNLSLINVRWNKLAADSVFYHAPCANRTRGYLAQTKATPTCTPFGTLPQDDRAGRQPGRSGPKQTHRG